MKNKIKTKSATPYQDQIQSDFDCLLGLLRVIAVKNNIHFADHMERVIKENPHSNWVEDASLSDNERELLLIEMLRNQYGELISSKLLEDLELASEDADKYKAVADNYSNRIERQEEGLTKAQDQSKIVRASAAAVKLENLEKAVKSLFLNEDGTPNYPAKGWTLKNKQIWGHLTKDYGYRGYAESSANPIITKVVAECRKIRNEYDCTLKLSD